MMIFKIVLRPPYKAFALPRRVAPNTLRTSALMHAANAILGPFFNTPKYGHVHTKLKNLKKPLVSLLHSESKTSLYKYAGGCLKIIFYKSHGSIVLIPRVCSPLLIMILKNIFQALYIHINSLLLCVKKKTIYELI